MENVLKKVQMSEYVQSSSGWTRRTVGHPALVICTAFSSSDVSGHDDMHTGM